MIFGVVVVLLCYDYITTTIVLVVVIKMRICSFLLMFIMCVTYALLFVC